MHGPLALLILPLIEKCRLVNSQLHFVKTRSSVPRIRGRFRCGGEALALLPLSLAAGSLPSGNDASGGLPDPSSHSEFTF